MPADHEYLLAAGQRRVVGFAVTLAALLGSGALLVASVILLGRLAGYFSSVLWPLCVAGVLAMILRPVVDMAEQRLRLRRLAAVVLLYGVFLLSLMAVLVLVLPSLIDQTLDFIAYLPTFVGGAMLYVERHYPQWLELVKLQLAQPMIREFVAGLGGEAKTLLAHALPSLQAAGGGALGLLAFSTHVAIIPVYLFFFLLSRSGAMRRLPDQLTFLRDGVRGDVGLLLGEFIGIVESFFRGQLIIAGLMGVLLGIGFMLIGLKFALMLGLVIGVLNVVPYLGTIIGLAVALPLAFLQPDGGWQLVGLVLLVKVIVQAIEGWVLTPRIMGARTGLHPVAIIVAIFFWSTVFNSVLGMLLAIPLTAFFVTTWHLVKRKYFDAL